VRQILQLYLVVALGGVYLLEQPASSCMAEHDRFRQFRLDCPAPSSAMKASFCLELHACVPSEGGCLSFTLPPTWVLLHASHLHNMRISFSLTFSNELLQKASFPDEFFIQISGDLCDLVNP